MSLIFYIIIIIIILTITQMKLRVKCRRSNRYPITGLITKNKRLMIIEDHYNNWYQLYR